jgi:hypothetical protein
MLSTMRLQAAVQSWREGPAATGGATGAWYAGAGAWYAGAAAGGW